MRAKGASLTDAAQASHTAPSKVHPQRQGTDFDICSESAWLPCSTDCCCCRCHCCCALLQGAVAKQRDVNRKAKAASSRAVNALHNIEMVKLYGNTHLEVSSKQKGDPVLSQCARACWQLTVGGHISSSSAGNCKCLRLVWRRAALECGCTRLCASTASTGKNFR